MMFDILNFVDVFLLSILAISSFGLLYYYWVFFGNMAFFNEGIKPSKTFEEPVSIIIAARNEYENLQKSLPAILNQDYPNFEVIVVNDCSWDESQAWLEELQKTEPRLKVSQLIEQEKYPTGKKFALTIGIKAAKNSLLLFTDADCFPASNQWLRLMQNQFSSGKDIVLGVSPHNKKAGFLNKFIRYEGLVTTQFYISAALANNPFMGVGRNLAYRKELFFKHKGFASHQHIKSGDDDLFINQAATASNTAIQINPDSFVYTEPKTTFNAWAHQKTRHLTTGKLYKTKHKRLLGMHYLLMFLFYVSLVAGLTFNLALWPVIVAIYSIKLISQSVIVYKCGKKIKAQALFIWVWLFDVLYLVYILLFGFRSLFVKNVKKW